MELRLVKVRVARVVILLAIYIASLVAPITTAIAASPSYSATVVADTPVSYWRLGETSGTAAADSVGSNNGVVKTGVTLGVAGAISNDANTAMRFDGAKGYVSVANAASLNFGADFSIEAWARPAALIGSNQTIVHKGGNSNASSWQYRLGIAASGQWRGSVYVGNSTISVTSPGTASLSSWTYLVLTRAGTGLTLYVNGAAVANTTVSGTVNTNTGILAIGRTGAKSIEYFAGAIDEVAVYAKALGAGAVSAHYAAGTTPPPPPPAPVAAFSGTPTAGTAPLAVAFSDASTGGPTSWSWDFGDSTGSTLQSPSHSYTAAGTYTVRLTATNGGGSNTATKTAYISASPGDPVLLGAGDIANCALTSDEATAQILDGTSGTVFTAGDNAYPDGTAGQFSTCYDPTWGRQKARTVPVPGNHDYGTPGAAGYYGYFGAAAGDPTKGYYTFDRGAWHVIVLNGECAQVGGCQAGSPQEQWLRSDLAAHTNACVMAIWHEPRFSSGQNGSDPTYTDFWTDLYYAGADVVVNGHDHDYERFAPQDPYGVADPTHGIIEFVVGTGGQTLTGFSTVVDNSVMRNSVTNGVIKFTLHATSYDWQFIPTAGAPFTETGTANCVAPPPPPARPTADFSGTPTSGTAPMSVAFSDLSSGRPNQWLWDFGDGQTSTQQNPIHIYTRSGTYTVSLTATNLSGSNTLTRTGYISAVQGQGASYQTTVLADSPSSYWRLGETSGTIAGDTASANRGSITGGVVLGVPGALAGDSNTAMGFNGANSYVSVPDAANLDFGGDFTVEAWAKPNSLSGIGGAVVHKGGSTGYPVWQYRMSITSGNKWRGTVFVGNTNITVTDTGTPSTTAWSHLVMTKAGSTLTLYVNGAAVATTTVAGIVNTSTGILAIGRTGGSSSDYFNGQIDEVAVYPTALPAARIGAHYAAGVSGSG